MSRGWDEVWMTRSDAEGASPGSAAPAGARSGHEVDRSTLPVLERLDSPICAWAEPSGRIQLGPADSGPTAPRNGKLLGWAPALPAEALGDREFLAAHGVRYAYVAGAMAGGIGSEEMVIAMGRAGMMGGFGAGGLDPERIERAIAAIQRALPTGQSYEMNLLHNPAHPDLEMAIADLYVRTGVPRISASGFLGLTLPLAYYRAKGLSRGPDGAPVARNHIMAKVSRPEVAREFMEPAPEPMLKKLVEVGRISPEQAQLAARVPMAEDITAEGDSGGHTDNQAMVPLLSSMCDLRDQICDQRGYARRIRVGVAGGISTPLSMATAFAAGAAYVLTGSINQCCVEAATSDRVKSMLCEVDIGGVAMAPAGDLFEMGARVQVLKHKTLFPTRARKLYELYRAYARWEDIPAAERTQVEERFFRCSFEEVWHKVEEYLSTRDPGRLARVRADPKQRLAYAFKWYMHISSRWATDGVPERVVDYQVWCGPAMAAFNHWVRGTFLEPPQQRRVAVVARNLLLGGATLLRARMLALQGVPLPPEAFRFRPRPID